jgi:hypothetical protein
MKNHLPLLEGCSLAWQHCLSHQDPPKKDENSNQVVDDKPFIDKRKPLSMTAVKSVLSNGPSPKKMDVINERKPSSMSTVKGVLNNGEHMIIPVTAKMIYSAMWNGERFVLKYSQPLYMVKLVGAVRNFRLNKNTYKLMWKMAPDLCK